MNMSDLTKAIAALKNGDVIVYPTDTLYGLGADIFNDDAIKKVFEIKRRPARNPLSIAVSNIEDIEKVAFLTKKARILSEHFLPGKLTLILRKKDIISDIITGGLDKVAVRIPDNRIALSLLSDFGPLTATSANIHGMRTLSSIAEIKMQLGESDVKLYIGSGDLVGQPSTIVDVTNNKINILREGTIKTKDILDAIKNE